VVAEYLGEKWEGVEVVDMCPIGDRKLEMY
jgi:hypothetical protein